MSTATENQSYSINQVDGISQRAMNLVHQVMEALDRNGKIFHVQMKNLLRGNSCSEQDVDHAIKQLSNVSCRDPVTQSAKHAVVDFLCGIETALEHELDNRCSDAWRC